MGVTPYISYLLFSNPQSVQYSTVPLTMRLDTMRSAFTLVSTNEKIQSQFIIIILLYHKIFAARFFTENSNIFNQRLRIFKIQLFPTDERAFSSKINWKFSIFWNSYGRELNDVQGQAWKKSFIISS